MLLVISLAPRVCNRRANEVSHVQRKAGTCMELLEQARFICAEQVSVSLEDDNNEAITLQLTRDVMHELLQASSKTIQLQNKKSGHVC